MTIKTFISVIGILTLASCNNMDKQDTAKQGIPKALEDKSSLSEVVSTRSYDDLVESLYNEAVSKNMDLKKLEDNIDELNKVKNDSTSSFDKFNGKNQSYFSSADRHVAQIKDTLLREKMKTIISNSLIKYNALTAGHNEFLKTIETKNLTIIDLHNILKIVKTLPLIEKYQKDNLPNIKSLKNYIKQQDELIGCIYRSMVPPLSVLW